MPNPANLNYFFSDAATFSISDAINGQSGLVMYDSLKQAALLPDLRQRRSGDGAMVIMPYDEKTPEALFSQLQACFGAENRVVKAREFYWAEYDAYDTLTFVVAKSGSSIPAAGAPVTVSIDALSKSQNGNYIKPLPTYYAWVKECNRQLVIISAVGGTSTVTLQPVNNEVLDLTQYSRYTIIIDPLRKYTLGDTTDMVSEGMVLNPPTMYKSYVQKNEKRIAINQDEIDGYVYDRTFKIIKGVDTAHNPVDYFYIPEVHRVLEAYAMDNKNLDTLFGRRDYGNQKGFDGLVPTAEKFGMWNVGYDIFTNVSLKQILFGMIKTLRRINGCMNYMLAHDFMFSMDWSDSIAQLITASKQSYQYEFFGNGGVGLRDFSYYEFGVFEAFGYKFTPYLVDGFDTRRYGAMLEYFALMFPLTKFRDQDGNAVPFLTFVNLEGAEPAKVDNIWSWDFRKQGKRTFDVFISTTWGVEIHRPTALGIIKKLSNQ